ncbi:MAG: hypothetical protein PHD36_04530 [Desulfotomaculaceae bacterium]|nr:hypothetical protein [Desulfotomaculaceae bacterium]
MQTAGRVKVRPEVLAAITAALAVYNDPSGPAYRITRVSKSSSTWKKAGIMEIMLGREIRTTAGH